ncbi:TetR/AcrR family transcriptional regulator [Natronomonas sp.]|uniref:TetR/AcrR family transcriptional regulator n=1 Tax=Natronomonas sp. TaxID=2184060 RepID=UPI002612AD45|nr:TetR/AcrR family transcriptional regulator [Natronomonas sp.]
MDAFEEPETTREEILAAAYRALCTHGYAELTVERIGEEFDKSVSLIYHHYDGKDDLLVACLEFMLESYRSETEAGPVSDPREAMERLCDRLVLTDAPPGGQRFVRALVGLRGQAPHNGAYRDYFTRSDRFFGDRIEAIIEAGIEDGSFRDVDPERAAAMINTVFSGAFVRYATTDDERWIPAVREELRAYNERTLYADPDGDGT